MNADELHASRERFLELARDFVPYVVAERDGLLFVVPTDDPTLGKLFVRSEKHKERTVVLRALERLEETGVEVRRGTFVDVGANVGTAAFAALGAGFAAVVAIEPVPRTFRLLRTNLALNRATAVRALQLALSDHAGTATMDVAEGSRKARVDAAGGEQVELARLDDVVDPDEVDFLLVDAEGHEVQVLAGGERVLARGVPLVLELNPKLLELAGRVDELAPLLARDYTHVLDLRSRGAELTTVDAVAGLVERYEGGSTDLLACRLP